MSDSLQNAPAPGTPVHEPLAHGTLETPSGKSAADENFPVGSWLIRPDLRRHVHTFYAFARGADDVADNPDLAPDDKVARLTRMGEIILGRGNRATEEAESLACVRMRASLAETKVTPQHCLDLLQAFTQDANKARYRDWDDLLGYCFLSASPVGRQLLDLHGEGAACRPGADALCNALQVINHLQDCAEDYKALDRIYLPTGYMAEEGAEIADLARPALTPAMRRVLDRTIAPLEGLLAECADLVMQVDDVRIALECQVIRTLAARLTRRLKNEDPIATRVELSKPVAGGLALGALASGLWRRRARPAPRPAALHS
ncbi:squalene synthase HpnC [Aliidongia dinghuensis]|uniref:Squalene synthase HpnC n=1 Tax=Aliidongia dinghuensis TaxID=1867774 RepID=A0A8J3E7A1_9PROT|nr:squalene/phytoene synthase family protein [Aliidongia dinghuensis]GGF37006.1 squalene synthase HpnC [Aliidongia dinghuensis]